MRKIVILLSAMLFMVACEKGNEEVREAKVVVVVYDENGKMLKGTGGYLDKYDTWHYIYSDGTMATGERTIGGKKYWFTGYGDWIR